MNDKKRELASHDVDVGHLYDLLNRNSDWVWEVDAQGRYTWASDVVTSLLGYPPHEVIGKTPFDFMPPGEAERVASAFLEIISEKRAFSGMVNRNQRADGSIVVLETSGIPLFDEQGALRGYRGVDRNISTLGERVLQLETIYDTTPVALCMIDRQGRLVMANKAMNNLLGVDGIAASERQFSRLMPEFWPLFLEDFALADMGDAIPRREMLWHDRCYDSQSIAVTDASRNVVGLSITWVDITARLQAEQKLAGANQVLQRHAQHDHLTGLFNRRYMDECLLNEVTRSWHGHFPLSICLVDIDFFKLYNDSQGHQAGDKCLQIVAKALVSSLVRSDDNVSRYGGEEFLVILPDTNRTAALSIAEHLREAIYALKLPHVSSPLGYLTISIGVATLDGDSSLADARPQHMIASALIGKADTALYAAKRQGRNRVMASWNIPPE